MSDKYVEKQRAINWLRKQIAFEQMLAALRNQPVAEQARQEQERKAA